jgi:hypothetical protein
MWIDPIVEELHNWRTAHAAQFHQDLQAMVDDLRQLERDWPAPKIDPPPMQLTTESKSPDQEAEETAGASPAPPHRTVG